MSVWDVWAFALPAVSFIEITLVGRLLVSEIIAIALLPWLLGMRGRLRVPRWFVLLWSGWLLSQIVTDLIVDSAFVDYSRGWAKIFFTLTNFLAILALVSTPRRARLFTAGLAVGGIFGYLLVPENNPYALTDPWKWAFALPVALVLAAALSGTASVRRAWPTVCAFAVLGAVDIRLGARSLGGVLLMSAGYLLLQALVNRGQQGRPPSLGRALMGISFCLATALTILHFYDAAAAGGALGDEARAKYVAQSGPLGVLVGGRSEALASTQAVLDSPFLGHGSWAKDLTYVYLLNQRLASLGYGARVVPVSGEEWIPTHSYLLGAWVEAGILGGLFWLAALVLAVWLLANLYTTRSALSPLLVLSAVALVWSVLFSPYGNTGRLLGPYWIAICVLGLRILGQGHVSWTRGNEGPSA